MKQNRITELPTNVFFIPERLREIDPDYFVVRNHEKKTYEIHHRRQAVTSYCLTVPYPELDCRTLHLVRKTRIQNAKNLLEEMDAHNRRLEAEQSRIPEEAEIKTKEVLSYLNSHESRETVDEKAFTTRFI